MKSCLGLKLFFQHLTQRTGISLFGKSQFRHASGKSCFHIFQGLNNKAILGNQGLL